MANFVPAGIGTLYVTSIQVPRGLALLEHTPKSQHTFLHEKDISLFEDFADRCCDEHLGKFDHIKRGFSTAIESSSRQFLAGFMAVR